MTIRSLAIAAVVVLAGCDAAEDVRVRPLPPLERATPEARIGLPEIAGSWHFTGWEVARGDSTVFERTFPSFGELRLEVQRLDSVAGTFVLGSGVTPVVGEVRRDGGVALVTYADQVPGSFLSGQFARDTLWLELTSVLPADEWPRDARAAFVREAPRGPIAWLRGARPQDRTVRAPADTVELHVETDRAVPPAAPGGSGTRAGAGEGAQGRRLEPEVTPAPARPAVSPPGPRRPEVAPAPGGVQAEPPRERPEGLVSPTEPPPPEPEAGPDRAREPEPRAEPEAEPEPQGELPELLGEPVVPPSP